MILMNIRVAILGIAVFFAASPLAFAQSPKTTPVQPQIIITWQTRNLYPSGYLAKAFPTTGSVVDLGLMAALNGNTIDLSRALITWRVDENVIGRTEGLQLVSFTSKKQGGTSHFIRVTAELASGESYEAVTRIPVVDPKVIIKKFGSESKLSLEAVPYFFNAQNLSGLSFSWSIAGKNSEKEGDNTLTIEANGGLIGSGVRADLMINNLSNPIEFAKTWITL